MCGGLRLPQQTRQTTDPQATDPGARRQGAAAVQTRGRRGRSEALQLGDVPVPVQGLGVREGCVVLGGLPSNDALHGHFHLLAVEGVLPGEGGQNTTATVKPGPRGPARHNRGARPRPRAERRARGRGHGGHGGNPPSELSGRRASAPCPGTCGPGCLLERKTGVTAPPPKPAGLGA